MFAFCVFVAAVTIFVVYSKLREDQRPPARR